MSASSNAALLSIAADVARDAAALVREAFGERRDADHKGEVDLVTRTDREAERLVRERLLAETGIAVMGEEEGGASLDERAWVVDPIDGTTNFVHGVPHFCVSIGLHEPSAPSAPTVGVVHDVMRDESFATSGDGVTCNGVRLPTPAAAPLDAALLVTGFPYDRRTNPHDNTTLWRAFMKRCRGVRRFGAAALDLAWVAAGRVDGFWEAQLKPWDIAGGAALVRASGAVVLRYDGHPHTLSYDHLVAAPRALADAMVHVIHDHDAPDAPWRSEPK